MISIFGQPVKRDPLKKKLAARKAAGWDPLDVYGTVTVATVTLRVPYCHLHTCILLLFIQGHIVMTFNIR